MRVATYILVAAAVLVSLAVVETRADSVQVDIVGPTFNYTDLASTSSCTTTLAFRNADLGPGRRVRISVRAAAINFSCANGGVNVPCSNVSWTTSGAVNCSGSSGTMDSLSYITVLTGNADATSGSVDVNWNLDPLTAGVVAYSHTLSFTYLVEII